MDYITYSKKIIRLKELIEKNMAKSPAELASKLGCSKRTINRMINYLKENNIDICYCRKQRKYVIKHG